MSNLAANLADTTEQYPVNIAVRLEDRTVSYAELRRLAGQFAAYLRSQGIGEGDRIALSVPNVPGFPVVFFGALQLGAIVIPMNPLFKPREVEYYLADSGAKILVGMPGDGNTGAQQAGAAFVDGTDQALLELIADLEPVSDILDRDSTDTAVLLYTSGTTGRPKGAELTHGSLDTNREVVGRTLFGLGPNDVIMGCLPLFHVFGLTCALSTAVGCGATLTLLPRFDPAKVLQIIERDKVTVFEGVPTMYQAMLTAADKTEADLSTLRLAAAGGASMPVEVMRQFEERFDATILEGYGLSETSPVASFSHPDAKRKPGSIGTPIEGVQMRLATQDGGPVEDGEVGEIAIRGHLLMKGYWGRPDATAQAIRDGWFYTGDLARQDEDGYYFIVDRAKDLIIRGGFNVYPREIEEVLYEHPDVAEAAVVGIPDEHYGEEIGAYIVLREGSELDADELRSWIKERVAAYKYPRVIRFIDALPKALPARFSSENFGWILPNSRPLNSSSIPSSHGLRRRYGHQAPAGRRAPQPLGNPAC